MQCIVAAKGLEKLHAVLVFVLRTMCNQSYISSNRISCLIIALYKTYFCLHIASLTVAVVGRLSAE